MGWQHHRGVDAEDAGGIAEASCGVDGRKSERDDTRATLRIGQTWSRVSMPRDLNEPILWNNSALRYTSQSSIRLRLREGHSRVRFR